MYLIQATFRQILVKIRAIFFFYFFFFLGGGLVNKTISGVTWDLMYPYPDIGKEEYRYNFASKRRVHVESPGPYGFGIRVKRVKNVCAPP